MHITPSQAFEDMKEALVQYLETAYKIAHPALIAERGAILRSRGVVAQDPFIEATPSFPTAQKLADLEHLHASFLPRGLAELVQHGVPVDRFPLYLHQQQALLAAFGTQHNLLVATGTGSGKTEAFLLPILADILREARAWMPAGDVQRRGTYDAQADVWLHARRHERRPAAFRAIILYPMNALVNDQLSRLRRILARGDSPDWQRRNLNGNLINFAMYTSLTQPTGSWSDAWRRDKFEEYLRSVDNDWKSLREDLRNTGGWPRPDSPEMLCRWDIQAAPPDILVTNYSMLEYMLVRPIEYPVFAATREWLRTTPDARLTLVLDEAHTYTGAKGTEVAYLVRRLKERLGISSGSNQFRAIATSASIPNLPGADDQLRSFTSDLFGESSESFTLIRTTNLSSPTAAERRPNERALQGFHTFQRTFDIQQPWRAIEKLAEDLDLGQVDHTLDPRVALYQLLEHNPDVLWVRARTARNATPLHMLSAECWQHLGSPKTQEQATAGVLSAGSFARASELPDTLPLLSMRIHTFFRGITGLWACMNPACPEVDPSFMPESGERPVGKLYIEPRPWCGPKCGARVLELFSCRHCGLLFLGGIPDTAHQSLWPWSDDLSGERQDVHQYRIFGVEEPHHDVSVAHRSIRTTLPVHANDAFVRRVYEVEAAKEQDVEISPFPARCPRCQAYRAPGRDGREVIEPLRTKGSQSLSVLVEQGFRHQPRTSEEAPNYGRKALLFSDSRQEAAILAANTRRNHTNDLFRQILFRLLHSCPECAGDGMIEEQGPYIIGQEQHLERKPCPTCDGTGSNNALTPITFADLRRGAVGLQFARGINPTNEVVPDFFTRLSQGNRVCYDDAELAFHIALRRELAEDEFSLEPLGLATWRISLPSQLGHFDPLTEDETRIFLRSIARILATESALLPPPPAQPWEWPKPLVKPYERRVIVPAGATKGRQDVVPYNLESYRKLGRYVIAVSRALDAGKRLPAKQTSEQWVRELHWPLWNALTKFPILRWAGAKIFDQVPYGIGIESFELHPLGLMVEQCTACSYVMSEALLEVCIRCGHRTRSVNTNSLRNYYRLAAFYARPDSPFDDPYPLRAGEHTAQIGSTEARNEERWFQDLFHDDQNHFDHRVDILSVTTTMEMGIDIGSLLCVGLRNVPPTVANYQQRAGRAGRRGSALATVITFGQQRSHDQYYFERPPEIVSDPPRVPSLYLNNEVIARRHVRSLVLQDFFYLMRNGKGQALFSSWGTVGDFAMAQTATKLRQYLATNRAPLMERLKTIVDPTFYGSLDAWLDQLVGEVQSVVEKHAATDSLFEELINAGLLPKYAFPVDVVSLSIPTPANSPWSTDSMDNDAMQRDLKIALAEYAPGAEVIRQQFPDTFKYRSAGLYDPFNKTPDYHPTGVLLECNACQSVALFPLGAAVPSTCDECHSFDVVELPYIRPPGFTVDASLPNGGAERYENDGRERSGYAAPARLLVGQTSFNHGQPRTSFTNSLYTLVRDGNLFSVNKGPDRNHPGYLICPTCGRLLDPDNPTSHTYPADVPPHEGKHKGPRASDPCPNRAEFHNEVVLGHPFVSQVILLGIDLHTTLDAPFDQPCGKAVWYSCGTLIANASARVLQIDPGELKTGVRAVQRSGNRLHGEIFLYDDVPGGAGYARAIDQHLEEILRKAADLGQACSNPNCGGACYHCMFDYRNQLLHPLLDRHMGTALLDYVLRGNYPSLTDAQISRAAETLAEYARAEWKIEHDLMVGTYRIPLVLTDRMGQRIGLWVVHPLKARPSATERQTFLAETGIRPAVHTTFDLERRPFWVLNNLL